MISDICTTLRIPLKGGVRVGSWDRPNLDVRVLRSASDDGELVIVCGTKVLSEVCCRFEPVDFTGVVPGPGDVYYR